jgi:hypothetical protein
MSEPKKTDVQAEKELAETISKVFKSIDVDNSGFLDKNEIKTLSKQLGDELSPEDLEKVFKEVDTSKDGKISLEEFRNWYLYGKVNKLGKLVQIRMKALNLLDKNNAVNKRIGKALKKLDAGAKAEEFGFHVSFGKEKSKSRCSVKLEFGKEADKAFDELKKDMKLVPEFSVVLRFKVASTPDAAFAELKSTIENTLTFFKMAFPDESGILEFINFSYAKDEKNVYLGISSESFLVQGLVENMKRDTLNNVPPEFEGKVKFMLGIKNNFKILKEKLANEKIVLTFMQGLDIKAEAKIIPDFLKNIRNAFLEEVDLDSLAWSRDLNWQVLGSLLNKAKGKLKFKDLDEKNATDFLKRIGSGESLDATPTTQELLDLARGSQFQEFLNQAPPFVNTLINFFRAHVKANISLFFKSTNFLGEFNLKTKGIREVFDYVFDRTD